METNVNCISTPAIGLSSFVAAERSATAPGWMAQGGALRFASFKAGYAHAAVRTTDLPVPVPRGAPV